MSTRQWRACCCSRASPWRCLDVAVPDVAVPDVDVPDVDVPDVAVGAGVDPAPDVDAASVSAGARRTSATVPENDRIAD